MVIGEVEASKPWCPTGSSSALPQKPNEVFSASRDITKEDSSSSQDADDTGLAPLYMRQWVEKGSNRWVRNEYALKFFWKFKN